MGMRFRKSFKVAPGVKVNLGKKSAGISVGGKYGGVSVNSKTGARARVSAPGTGISYSEKIGGSKKKTKEVDKYVSALSEMSDDEFFDYSEQIIELANDSTTDEEMIYYTNKLDEINLEHDRRISNKKKNEPKPLTKAQSIAFLILGILIFVLLGIPFLTFNLFIGIIISLISFAIMSIYFKNRKLQKRK